MEFTNNLKKITLSQLNRYARIMAISGGVLSHKTEDILSCMCDDGGFAKRVRYHCNDVVCTSIMSNYELFGVYENITVVQEKEEEKYVEEEVFSLDLMAQRTQLCAGQVYDYRYAVETVDVHNVSVNGEAFVLVGEPGRYIDCAYSSKEDNLHRKPHHYRRAYAESRGVGMEPCSDGNLYVSDPFPYNSGDVGGYYIKLKSDTYIKTKLARRNGINEVLVYSSGASGKKWQRIAVTSFAKEGYYIWDTYIEQVVCPTDHAHSFLDRAALFSNYKMELRQPVEYQRSFYVIEVPGIGLGLRETVYRLLNQYNVIGSISNNATKMVAKIGVPDSKYTEVIMMLDRFLSWRGFKMKILEVEWQISQGQEDLEKRLVILPQN